MAMFRRGLSDSFVSELNRGYAQGSWLTALFDDPDLFVAVRDEYVNVYHQGQSLVRITFDGTSLIGETHYKYLLRDDVVPECVRSVDGATELPVHRPSRPSTHSGRS